MAHWVNGDTGTAKKLNQTGKVEDFPYGETIAINESVYLKASDQKVYKTDANFSDERIHNFIGFALEAGIANDVKEVQITGKVIEFSGLIAGSKYYLSNTAGATGTPTGTYKKEIGIAVSTTELLIRIPEVLEFVEIEIPFQSTVTNVDVWENWDLSSFIPVGAKYVDVFIIINQGKEAGVRKIGSVVNRIFTNWNTVGAGSFTAHGQSHETQVPVYGLMPFYVTMTVELDSNRHIERRTNAFLTFAYYTIVGYWK